MQLDIKKLSVLLNTCTAAKSLAQGKLLHQKAISLGLHNNTHLCKSLITFYLSFHLFKPARLVVETIQNPSDVSLWNNLLAAYSKNQMYQQALLLFDKLRLFPDLQPDSYTYPSALKACGGLVAAKEGEKIHTHVVKSGFWSDIVVSSSLVGMYAKCGLFESAIRLFDEMPERDVACWNTVISCYYQDGQASKALELFEKMRTCGFEPDSVTFTTVISACARLLDLGMGRRIHEELITRGFELDGFVTAALVDMYGKCGCLSRAREVFEQIPVRSVVSWNSMIGGYSLNGDSYSCLEIFSRMNNDRIRPTSTTISSLLIACSRTSDLRNGKFIHGYVLRNHIEVDIFVNCSLIDLYFNCGNVVYAESAFEKMPRLNVVLWNVMISGYVTADCCFKALEAFHEMRLNGVRPDAITFTSVLSACAQLAALEQGKEIHKEINDRGLEPNEVVMCAILEMYAKCGAVKEARAVFDQLPARDTVSWTSMIMAYASHGRSLEALELFHEMQKAKAKPDPVTLLAVISACSHGGLVDEGCYYFSQIAYKYGIKPTLEHYSCLIDLLGRSGRLSEAYNILKGTPDIKADAGLLGSLFFACSLHRNLELGEEIARLLIEMDPDDHSTYIVLSNMYASAGRWDEVRKVRTKIKERGLKKNPGCSWIEVNKKTHQFFVKDDSHPQAEMIYGCLGSLARHMEKDKSRSSGTVNGMVDQLMVVRGWRQTDAFMIRPKLLNCLRQHKMEERINLNIRKEVKFYFIVGLQQLTLVLA